jgi:hypothetical protein
MNRGNRRERAYRSQADYGLFLDRLGRFAEEFDVDVLSYCRGVLAPSVLARELGLTYSGSVQASGRGRVRAAAGDLAWARAVALLAQDVVKASFQKQV